MTPVREMLRCKTVTLSLRTVCRVVTLILLCQTGLDLAVPSLCTLDSERLSSAATGPASSAVATAAATTPRPGLPARPIGHVDDCFCCSGCVEVQPVFYIVPVVRLAPHPNVLPDNFVPLLSRHFFHPPRFLS